MPTRDESPPTKAERAAAARALRKAAQEAAALRENLRRRKAQARDRATKPVGGEGPKECR